MKLWALELTVNCFFCQNQRNLCFLALSPFFPTYNYLAHFGQTHHEMVWSRKTENRREVKIHTRGDIWAGLEGISFNAMQTFAKYDANTKLANTWHDVAEANCCECDETEVEGVKERPDMVDTIFESLLMLPQ